MAIDTALKRISVVQFAQAWSRHVFPFPTGSITSGDRYPLSYSYSGIAFNPPTPPPTNTRIILGISMVAVGLTVLYGITTQLEKGLVEDDLNLIPRT